VTYYDVQRPDLDRLEKLAWSNAYSFKEVSILAMDLLVILAGFPCLAQAMIDCDFLTRFVNDIPLARPLKALARFAKITGDCRDAVIDYGAVYQIELLPPAVFDIKVFACVCGFARAVAYYEVLDSGRRGIVTQFFVRLADIESIQSEPTHRYLRAVVKAAENPSICNSIPAMNVLGALQRHWGSEDQDWYCEAARFLCAQARLPRPVAHVRVGWKVVLEMLGRFAGAEEIVATASMALIDLVATDVGLFISEGLVQAVVARFDGASFLVKSHIAAAVSAAFCEASVEQFVILVDLGLGALLLECLPEAGYSADISAFILRGLCAYLRKMELLANRSELFASQFAENEDFLRWMREMDDSGAFSWLPEWEAMTSLVTSIAQSQGIKT
jgi:hypothetical protein